MDRSDKGRLGSSTHTKLCGGSCRLQVKDKQEGKGGEGREGRRRAKYDIKADDDRWLQDMAERVNSPSESTKIMVKVQKEGKSEFK